MRHRGNIRMGRYSGLRARLWTAPRKLQPIVGMYLFSFKALGKALALFLGYHDDVPSRPRLQRRLLLVSHSFRPAGSVDGGGKWLSGETCHYSIQIIFIRRKYLVIITGANLCKNQRKNFIRVFSNNNLKFKGESSSSGPKRFQI